MAKPQSWGDGEYPRIAREVMQEIADRCGVEIDPRNLQPSPDAIPSNDIEDNALEMSMREVAGYIAAMMGGVWTITDEGKLYCVPLGDASRLPPSVPPVSVTEDNAESLSVSDPLEAWSGVRAVWDGDEYDASSAIIKRGDELILKGSESGRVMEVKLAFGQVTNPAQALDRWATWLLGKINSDVYCPFEAVNAVIDPAAELGDAVTLPDGQSVIFSMSGELDGLCAVDVSAPPDEALNTAYPASWQAASSGARVTGVEVEQIVTDAWNAAFDGGG